MRQCISLEFLRLLGQLWYAKILTAWAIYGNPSSKLHFENSVKICY